MDSNANCKLIFTHRSTESRGDASSNPPTAYRQPFNSAKPIPALRLDIDGCEAHLL